MGTLQWEPIDKIVRRDINVHHMFVASAKAISQGKKIMGDIKFGAMFALSEIYPATCNS